jgi:hypothetical protein
MRFTKLIELKVYKKLSLRQIAELFSSHGLTDIVLDQDYPPVFMNESGLRQGKMTVLVRVFFDSEKALDQLKQLEAVVAVWDDTPISPFMKGN